ncbi:MAG: long-chain fatty acid--CoA ligase [Microbacteriaceae bacterium]|nr:long-chain fatty acid--CoA ligase [Microbacteriaceae bacterium]
MTQLLEDRVAQTPDRVIFGVQAEGGWRDVTAAQFRAEVIAVAKGFVAAGVQPGARVGFMCKTRYEWTLVDFALFYAGAVMAPIYETSSAAQLQWILENAEAVGFFAESDEHLDIFNQVRDELPQVSHVWSLDGGALDELRAAGRTVSDEELERRRANAVGSDMATLIYTSGSSGRPKGCLLTHSNFVELARNSRAALTTVIDEDGSSTLLFIPLAHVFARFISILSVCGGVRVGHAEPQNLLPAFETFKPSFLLAVPRVFEKVYNGAEQTAETAGKGKIFRKAAAVAVAHSQALSEKGRASFWLGLQFKIFDKLVFSKLRAKLGGRVRYAVSGSAPLSTYLGHFYSSLGIKILEGYGLTETTAPATVNVPEKFKVGTVGPALPGTSIKLAEDGEILIKGVGVFTEYWKNPELTAEAFTPDGYFRTGDVGQIDDDGYLRITGRKKEILVTAGGKNVAPSVLEDPIRSNTIVGQAVVVGDKKPFVAALITLDPEMLPGWLQNNGENPEMSLADAAENPKVLAEVQRAVDAANTNVSRAESVRKFKILPVEFTEQSGHLTPKMSIKRGVIMEDFAADVEGLYRS